MSFAGIFGFEWVFLWPCKGAIAIRSNTTAQSRSFRHCERMLNVILRWTFLGAKVTFVEPWRYHTAGHRHEAKM